MNKQFFVLAAIKNCNWRNGHLEMLASEALLTDGKVADHLDRSYMAKLYEEGVTIPGDWFSPKEFEDYSAAIRRIDEKKSKKKA